MLNGRLCVLLINDLKPCTRIPRDQFPQEVQIQTVQQDLATFLCVFVYIAIKNVWRLNDGATFYSRELF